MKSSFAKRQHGAALLAMLAVLALGASWYLVSRLNADSGVATATRKVRNAEVLNRAKQALIGYVAMQAAEAGERNPGRLPCPEGANFIGNNAKDGTSAPTVGAPTCASIGRLPWRTLGLDKLVDTAGEPLWYVVGPSWRLTTTTSTLLINSNTPSGDIIVDGQQTVALIVAPGAAMNVQTSPTCTARNQARSAPSPAMDARDYIECFISANLNFFTSAPSTSYNDQVVRITVADIMPAIEAAIAHRIEREIAPQLKSMYASASWGPLLSATNPVYPHAAPFTNPGMSSFQGDASACSSGVCRGLLPLVFSRVAGSTTACTPAADPACDPTFVAWQSSPAPSLTQTGGAGLASFTCSVTTVSSFTQIDCTLYIYSTKDAPSASMNFTLQGTAQNVARAMRSLDTSVTMTGISGTPSASAVLNSDASATVTLTASIPQGPLTLSNRVSNGFCEPSGAFNPATQNCFMVTVAVPVSLLADHAILNSNDPTYGWFWRNEWYRLAFYAVAQTQTAAALPTAPACTTLTTCLSVANVTPSGAQRAILILAGRSINGTTRPSPRLADYLESGNATGAFTRNTISSSAAIPAAQRFNDRVVVVGSN